MPTRITCPHCSTVIVYEPIVAAFSGRPPGTPGVADRDAFVGVDYQLAPCCNRYIVSISNGTDRKRLVWPPPNAVQPLPDPVPAKYARNYEEAMAVLTVSPRASAALARQCLRQFLKGEVHAREGTGLAAQIADATGRVPPLFPPRLAAKLDRIPVIGNFSAHPKKDTSPDEVTDVEPQEAAHLLRVLWEVLLHHFVRAGGHPPGSDRLP